MPSQLIHLEIAAGALRRASPGTESGALEAPLLGTFLLGAIAPDAWAISGQRREDTHFWSLADDTSGATRLIRTHPHLSPTARLSPQLRAFLAGYLCHLVTDEQWTFTVYRPAFGRHSPFRASPEGQRVQIALQAAMEQALRDAPGAPLQPWLTALAGATVSPGAPERETAELPFVRAGAVERWRDLQLEAGRLPTARDAFRYVLERTARPIRAIPSGSEVDPAEGDRAGEWGRLDEAARRAVSPQTLATFRARAGAACSALLAAWWPYNAPR